MTPEDTKRYEVVLLERLVAALEQIAAVCAPAPDTESADDECQHPEDARNYIGGQYRGQFICSRAKGGCGFRNF